MKKVIYASSVLVLLLFVAACSKTNTPSPAATGNWWAFKDTTYKTTQCGYVTSNGSSPVSYLSAYSDTPYNYGTAQVNFATGYTITAGTYTVVSDVVYNLANNQVNIGITRGGLSGVNYYSSGGGTVNVSLNSGKITVSGSNISMYNAANANDISTLSLNLTQTQ